MGRGSKRTTRRRVQPKEKGSDESDEEYRVGEDEEFDESDEYCSLEGDESEGILAEFDEYEEEDEDEKKAKRVVRSKTVRKSFPQKKAKANRIKKPPQKRRRVSYKAEKEEEEEEDYEDEDEDDEEFILDESDCVDEEDEIPEIKKSKRESRPPSQKRGFSRGQKRSRKSKVLKKATSQKSGKNRRLTRKTSSAKSGEVTKKNLVVEEKSRNISARRKRRTVVDSDSDFVSSVSSDFEYTISEEEREQVREASKFCTNFKTNLRSSSLLKRSQEETPCLQRRRTGRKGKEKVEDKKNEVVKQVCGICLSEEGKKTVPGTLNCCSHYFCFSCIMEWSKVESRCPLCKQRFMTISKPARSNIGFDLRTVVIQVPERDQVYQPSEEELRGYLDPYENVICTECQQGGEDALMLLCDICDSPAHTFCVGLGREVPEGNWYCEGCRPSALASLNPQGLSPTSDRRAINMSGPSSPFPGGIDLNALYVPETPLTQETGTFPSFRRPIGDHYASSPASGAGVGAVTVSTRRMQHQMHYLLNNRRSQELIRTFGIAASSSGVRLFGSQLDQGRVSIPHRTIIPETAAPLYSNIEGRLEDNTFSLAHNRDPFPARSGHFRGQVQNQTSTSVAAPLLAEHGRFGMAFNPSLVHEQLHPCTSRSSIGADASPSSYACREVSHFNVEKGQVQQMVKSHLKSLSRDVELGNGASTDIARRSTHTILAACQLEHRGSEVHPVQPSLFCNHLGVAGVEMSMMRDYCSSCFNLFVKDVVRQIINAMQESTVIGV